jgi:ketosteroid isomerase-like protein
VIVVTVDSVTRQMDTFNEAFHVGDPAMAGACLAANAIIWHNTDGVELTAEGFLVGMKAVTDLMPVRRVQVIRRDVLADCCVQQQAIVGLNAQNRPVRILTCIVCRFAVDGRIERIDEYLDSAAMAQLTAKD